MAASKSTPYTAEKLRVVADNISKQLGVEDSEGVLTDDAFALLAKAEKFPTHSTKNDKRFPNISQTGNCWTAFNEYQYCVKVTGDFYNPKCMQRRRDFLELCPTAWVEGWKEQIEAGTYMGIGDVVEPPEEPEAEAEPEPEPEAAPEAAAAPETASEAAPSETAPSETASEASAPASEASAPASEAPSEASAPASEGGASEAKSDDGASVASTDTAGSEEKKDA